MKDETTLHESLDLAKDTECDITPVASADEDGQVTLSELEYLELKKTAIYNDYLDSIDYDKREKFRSYERMVGSRKLIYLFITLVSVLATMFYFYGIDLFFHLLYKLPFKDFWDYSMIFMPIFLAVALIIGIIFLVKVLGDYKHSLIKIDLCDKEISKKYDNFKSDPVFVEIEDRIDELKSNN